ncbi:MAG: DUF362 domain-containing protein [Deltaproteobacteria bacterium]|nr:DUF362 domain-containing protein [Deltaproteobacteria bacterium]
MGKKPLHENLYIANHDGNWEKTIFRLLDSVGLELPNKKILLKPNLVEALAPPITTPVALIEAVLDWIRENYKNAEVVIGDGTGSDDYESDFVFDKLGYAELSERKNVELVDLNHADLVELKNPKLLDWPTMHLPRIVMDSFLISVPVLKAHSLAGVTLTIKNMMGALPPSHYQGGGHWKKSIFHEKMQENLLSLAHYRVPDFTILDATVGMSEAHLWGAHCDPPPRVVASSLDPVAIDAYGCKLLKRRWQEIGHIKGADGKVGYGEPKAVIEI